MRVRVGLQVLVVLAIAAVPFQARADYDPEELVGTPELGATGITETVDELMARDRASGAKRPAEDAPSPQTDASVRGTEGPPTLPQAIGTSFRTVGSPDSGFIPPDTAGDVGPTEILVHVRGRVTVFSKAGVLGALNVTAATFWSSVAAGGQPVFPQVRYDRLSGRWILMALNSTGTNNRVMIAVQTNPGTITGTSSFTFYQFNQTAGGGVGDNSHACDYPTLGIDSNALYVGCNMVNNSAQLKAANVYVVRKSSLIPAPGTLAVTAFRDISTNIMGPGPVSPIGVDNDDPQSAVGYVVGVDMSSLTLLQLRRVSTPGGVPTLSGNLSLTVPATVRPISQPASGSTTNLDVLDNRLVSASLHKNKITGATTLWTSQTIQVDATCASIAGGGRNGARWYEITGSAPTAADPLGGTPTLVQSGTLCDPAASTPTGYIYPSVTGTGQGHMALGSSFAASNLFAGVAAAGRLRIDLAGATQAATTVQSGLASYQLLSSGRNRWGDYSFTGVDPNDDQTVWSFQEYADSPANNWAVRAVQLKAPPPPTLTGLQATVCAGLASTPVTLTGTNNSPMTGAEFFDPGSDTGGPGYANHITASVTGGVTLSGAASIVIPGTPSTQSVLQVTLPINTTGVAAGLKDITITNPDGQTTTGIGILQVNAPQTPLVSNNGPLCAGATLVLSASTVADATYSWTGPNGFTSTLQNPTIPAATAANSGTYSVTVTVSGCTSVPATTAVVVIDEAATCDDGNACTTGDTCGGGTCNGGPPPDCDDINACTADSCNPASGCAHTDPVVACNDNNPCTDDSCDPPTGCVHTNNTGACSDGNACTLGDTCSGGTCLTGTGTLDCNDNNVCTIDSCDPATGCVNTDISAVACDDSNVCTDDHCDPVTGCFSTNNTASCQDGNACTTGDTCSGGTCQTGAGALDCNDNNGCTDDSCSPASGCVHANNTVACDDGSVCTVGDSCGGGTCNGGPALICNDGDFCTADSCHPVSGCSHTDISASCNDSNVCTADSCNPASGCVHTSVPGSCDDGNACTTGDTCGGGTCIGGPALVCNDDNVCTTDSCNPGSGCVFTDMSAACDDGNICTTDGCENPTGCVHTNNFVPCSDGDACTAPDSCAGGTCHGGSIVICNDNNVCTTDTCVSSTGCVFSDVTAFACNDNDVCTDDLCNPSSGCFHTNNTASCNDGNACTTGDTCSGGNCQNGTGTLDCDDNNVCTNDSCNSSSGCVHSNNTASCNDGNACTTGDTCGGGTCNGGAAPNCNDNNACTADSCTPGSGCVHTDITAACDDGNVCTDDSCVPATGCAHANNTASCSDGNACTTGDTCGAGSCQPGAGAPDCDDGNSCTADSCNPASGCVHTDITASCNDSNPCTNDSCNPASGCVHTNNTVPCTDGNACTLGDVCGSGTCHSGLPRQCSDSNFCTDDSCNPASGCVHTNNTIACDDDSDCTVGDVCGGGSCHAGAPLVCNDSNPCTDDSCDPSSGCTFTPALQELAGLSVNGHTTTTVTWTAPPGSAVYDVVTSTLGDLRTNGTATATCLSNDVSGAAFTDPRPNPSSGQGYYYLTRVQNACGTGTYGFDSEGNERTPTAACP